jgi:intein/homing endonuclease
MFKNSKLTKIVSVETTEKVTDTYDIEVESELHAFTAKHPESNSIGVSHNSALISLSNLSDERMRGAKNGQWWEEHVHRALANNSVAYTEKPEIGIFMKEWLSLYDSKSGERGIFNRVAATKQAKRNGRRETDGIELGVNPCLTGETLVYVADGRGDVSIKQLTEEGKDVPVFCFDDNNELIVRMMRSPRITGYNQPIYKLTLDDGSIIRATGNHKFKLRNGEYKELTELVYGDSLRIITRYQASYSDIFKKNYETQDYMWINAVKRTSLSEHRLIAAFHNNIDIVPKGKVVHHKDRNALNNFPSNLEIMTVTDHNSLHAQDNDFIGENNPNAKSITNDELKEHILMLTKQLGCRVSNIEWIAYAKEHNLPLHFSKYRTTHLGGIHGFAKWAALELGYDHVDVDTRVTKRYMECVSNGYDCEIVDNQLMFHKNCEVCGTHFTTKLKEHSVCSASCGQSNSWKNEVVYKNKIHGFKIAHDRNRKILGDKQIEIYSKLKFELGRTPEKKEWISACKANGISYEISRSSSPFRYYKDLKETALTFNHKVVSVEIDGYEDVYNGTVDDFHNFFVGGFQSTNKYGKREITYLNNLNCGEVLLRGSGEMCNLSEVIAREKDTLEQLCEKVRVATIIGTFQATLTDFRYLRHVWKRNCDEERLLGVSLTGIMDHPVLSGREGHEKTAEWTNKMRETAIEVNKEWAAKLGINQSAALSVVKPSGCRTVDSNIKTTAGNKNFIELMSIAGYDFNDFNNQEKVWIDPKDMSVMPKVYDENNELQEITKLYINGMYPVIEIEFEDGKKHSFTPNHQLMTTTGWKRVDELTLDDEIISYENDHNSTTTKIKKITKLAPVMTVDIEVSNTHSYQLDNGVVSHNTVSQLVNSSSGIHPRYAKYYIRTVRQDKKDPLGKFLKDSGVPCEDDVTKPESTWVFSFPQKSPEHAVFRNDMTAIQQLEHYLIYKNHWCEHNPSITVYVREEEWLEVGAWVYKHFDDIGGISFLPYSDGHHNYVQAPYKEITEEEYNELFAKMPTIDWEKFVETEDVTTSSQELACTSATGCEII